MYSIGEKVVYGAMGVMEIVDITEQTVGELARKYYVLKEYASPSASLTYVPVDNAALTSQLQPLLTVDQITEAIRLAKTTQPIAWVEENRARSEMYKRILATADRAQMLAMIRLVYETGIRREAEGKKNFIADENVMRRAQKNIATEFSLVLGIPESEIFEYIKNVK
jgi:CarD family transcriptional regulator